MKRMMVIISVLGAMLIVALVGCTKKNVEVDIYSKAYTTSGEIYLYGERHGIEKILSKELELWGDYYENYGMRHLFIEHSYYTAAYMNLWMKSEDDQILDMLFEQWNGTQSDNTTVRTFFLTIKEQYPETIFHGTDVGHQYNTTGKKYIEYLEDNGLSDTIEYKLTEEAIEQGRNFYKNDNHSYRENMMVENFVREMGTLDGEDIMGIYGAAHTDIDGTGWQTKELSMANQLRRIYGDKLHSEDLSIYAKVSEPIRVDIVEISEKEYSAHYYGEQDLTGFKDYSYREYWIVEEAYEDFKRNKKTGDYLPYDNYIMMIEKGQVMIIDYIKVDGSKVRRYYRADGDSKNNEVYTVEISVD